MVIDTTTVTGRRSPKYQTLDDVLDDAERLASVDVELLGNWSLGQIFRHLSIAINGSIDGFAFRIWYPVLLFARLFLKKRFLSQGIWPGMGRSRKWDSVKPKETSTAEGLAVLRAAVARLRQETKRSPHPALGMLSSDEWHQFHLRHAELHLSFARLKN